MEIDSKTLLEALGMFGAFVAHALGVGKFIVVFVDKKMRDLKTDQDTINAGFAKEIKEIKDNSVKREDFNRLADLSEKRHENLTNNLQVVKDTTVKMISDLGNNLNNRLDSIITALSTKTKENDK